jgi:hypothetical protein
MGFNQCYISSIETLQLELNNVGLETFVKRYRKYECITGPSECFGFLEEKIKEYEEVIDNNINNNIS